ALRQPEPAGQRADLVAAAVHEDRGVPRVARARERAREVAAARVFLQLRPADLDQQPHGASPASSGSPSTTFMFCSAWPEAPFTRLSIAETTTTCAPAPATARSQKFVRCTRLSSGRPRG